MVRFQSRLELRGNGESQAEVLVLVSLLPTATAIDVWLPGCLFLHALGQASLGRGFRMQLTVGCRTGKRMLQLLLLLLLLLLQEQPHYAR